MNNTNQIVLEVFNPNQNEIQHRRLSRKLALLCYFLNTRLDCNVQFVHGGVYTSAFTNNFKPEKDQTAYELVVNKAHCIRNASYLDDENVHEDDFRGFSQHFVNNLAELAPEFNVFKNFKFVECWPIVVGNYYLKEHGIDGRRFHGNYYQQHQGNYVVHQAYNAGSVYQNNPSYIQGSQVMTQSYLANTGNIVHQTGNIIHQTGNVIQHPATVIQHTGNVGQVSNVSVGGVANVSVSQQNVIPNSSLTGSVHANKNASATNVVQGRNTVMNIGNIGSVSLNNDSSVKVSANPRLSSVI